MVRRAATTKSLVNGRRSNHLWAINVSADTSVLNHNKLDEKLQYVAQGAHRVL